MNELQMAIDAATLLAVIALAVRKQPESPAPAPSPPAPQKEELVQVGNRVIRVKR